MNDEVTVLNPSDSTEFERQVALQATIAAIMFVGEGILFNLRQRGDGPSLEQCIKRAKQLVEATEKSVGEVD